MTVEDADVIPHAGTGDALASWGEPDSSDEFERNNSRVSLKTDIRERKYNSKSEELQERVHYFIYCLSDSLG